MRYLPVILLAILAALPLRATAEERTLVVRERNTANLLDGAFSFRVLKLRGYSIDIRVGDERRVLKIGQAFSAPNGACTVTFRKISPETRIARFRTDCP